MTAPGPAAEALPPAIDSRSGFIAAVHWGLATATARQARRIVCADPDFSHWPLDDEALLRTLVPWLKLPQRQLVLLAAGFDAVPRQHPRFVRWRRDWSHAIATVAPPSEMAGDLPSVLVDDTAVSVQLIDAVHWRGRAQVDAGAAHLWRQRIDVLLQRSSPVFPVTTLGA